MSVVGGGTRLAYLSFVGRGAGAPQEVRMRVAERLEQRLRAALSPSVLEITDFSAAHAGHAGARPGGQTHFNVRIVAPTFAGRSRVQRQRLVLQAAGDLMVDEIHALTISAREPGESD
jgi:BolA protein